MLNRSNFESHEQYISALRDWFAGQALAGLAASQGDSSPEYAYWLADAMLAARAKGVDT